MVMLMGLNSLFLLLNLAAVTHNSLGEEVPHKFSRDDFPPGFIFGAGTSAYQVEGAAAEDGRKPSIWDVFTHAGKMPNKSTGDVAADQYHKYKEDVKLAHDIGLDAYRFSISWSRLLPDGRGAVNPKGLMYYNNLINELISHGIQPHVTLQHLDPPQALEDEYKGWLSPRIIDDFKGYAEVCFREFGDRVRHWSTINEPNMFPLGSYDLGFWPPQRCSNPFGLINCTVGNSSTEPYIVTHNELLAHAAAARLYKDKYQATQGGSIGISIYCFWYVPYTNSSSDVAATQRALDFNSGWILRPLVSGDYPETMKEMVGSRLPSFTKEESEVVKASFDYIGLVHYTTMYVSDDQSRRKTGLRDYQADVSVKFSVEKDGVPINELPGATPVVPWGLQGILEYIKQTYNNPPIFIHENGYGSRNQESMPLSKALNDASRVSYLDGYLRSLLNAIRDGSNTKGYFVWSLLDCFEVLNGYESRFGLYHVDFKDQDLRRYPKLSAHWYSNFLKSNPNNKHLESTSFAKYHSTV
ncbi:beta-glucosidase 22 isoform X2 [Amborella trichopoda]|uniref:Beta-glucosidase n=1 Tax=Amborella trichopoda TaxID=13333 RepID=U5CUR2_AMBTC|nr:beta-glucosidase 22 isoform X2 [Amborella trichopoda]ERN17026.1 hypothetical protein AMTR_s00057p00222890 [Amborella trichopoda]|eukprot:XP_006855559.1 beta-glucosidase 22 isoform X2 [Amborella trichopoda]